MKIPTIALSVFFCMTPLHAALITYGGTLLGSNEVPPNASPATGIARVTYDSTAHTLSIFENFSGLTSGTTASHIHCCTSPSAGVATTLPTFANFPLGVTSGTYSNILDLTLSTSWNPAFVTANGGTTAGAEAALAAGLAAGTAYLNVHTTNFPSGEIRANLVPLPEPGSMALMGAALIAIIVLQRRMRN